MTTVFVVNSGSSSIKYRIIETITGETMLSGIVDRIGQTDGDAKDHQTGIEKILDGLPPEIRIELVGHRVVHGGDRFSSAVVLDDAVIEQIEELSPLAPLHNPANLIGIRATMAALSSIKQVAVFDTAFHQTIPQEAYLYAIDTEIAENYGIRKYGFHGTSVKYVSRVAAELLGFAAEQTNLIVLHLGNGASATAVQGGRSVDTSMGLTPLQGLVMGTRSGDIDAAVVAHLNRVAGMSVEEIDSLLNNRGGMLGLTGFGDMRDVEAAVAKGDRSAATALAVWRHRLRGYLGAYTAGLGRVDAIVFTAGIGENSPQLRELACQGLEHLGVEVDSTKNYAANHGPREISKDSSLVRVFVIPTNEELEIARQAEEITRS